MQLDVHGPHEGESESERANWHAHLLITTRRIEGENFAAKKARDLDPEVRRAGGRAVVADGEAWGALWRDHQNRYFQTHGLDIRVDPTATHVGQHIGPVRMRKADTGIAEHADQLRQANEAAARDPDQVLATLTRHTATFTARDAGQLAWQMARGEMKAASVAWATREELAPALRMRAQPERPAEPVRQTDVAQAHSTPEEAYWQRMVTRPPVADPMESLRERAAVAEAMAGSASLIPAYGNAERDSLGRGLDPASIAVAVAKDSTVQQERATLVQYLRGAYRDPAAAKAQLDEMVKSQGWTSTAARLAPDPEQIGPLRGKLGFFAGARARAERATAERVAKAAVSSLDDIARAETKAAQAYRSSVQAQRRADAVVIPKLSERAEAVVVRLTMAPDDATRAAVWRGMAADADVARELGGFREAVRQRFGDDAVRTMRRSYGGSIEAASVRPEHRAAFGVVSRTVHVLSAGEFARESQMRAERLAQR